MDNEKKYNEVENSFRTEPVFNQVMIDNLKNYVLLSAFHLFTVAVILVSSILSGLTVLYPNVFRSMLTTLCVKSIVIIVFVLSNFKQKRDVGREEFHFAQNIFTSVRFMRNCSDSMVHSVICVVPF